MSPHVKISLATKNSPLQIVRKIDAMTAKTTEKMKGKKKEKTIDVYERKIPKNLR